MATLNHLITIFNIYIYTLSRGSAEKKNVLYAYEKYDN